MRYSYVCFQCGWVGERDVAIAGRNDQTCACGACLEQSYRLKAPMLRVPAGFHTSKELVMGPPGSPQRDEFEASIRRGEIVPAGPGSRWI